MKTTPLHGSLWELFHEQSAIAHCYLIDNVDSGLHKSRVCRTTTPWIQEVEITTDEFSEVQ